MQQSMHGLTHKFLLSNLFDNKTIPILFKVSNMYHEYNMNDSDYFAYMIFQIKFIN